MGPKRYKVKHDSIARKGPQHHDQRISTVPILSPLILPLRSIKNINSCGGIRGSWKRGTKVSMSAALDWKCSKTPRGEPRPIEYMARTKSVAKGSQEA